MAILNKKIQVSMRGGNQHPESASRHTAGGGGAPGGDSI